MMLELKAEIPRSLLIKNKQAKMEAVASVAAFIISSNPNVCREYFAH